MEQSANQDADATAANNGQPNSSQNGGIQIIMTMPNQNSVQNLPVSLQTAQGVTVQRTASQILQMGALAQQKQQQNNGEQGLGMVQQTVKRPLGGSAEPIANKIIVRNNPNTNQPVASAVVPGSSSLAPTKITPTLIQTADGRTLLTDGNGRLITTSGSPIKLVTVSHGAAGQKNIIVTSTKKTPAQGGQSTKIPIAPIKSPTKTIVKSPKKINEIIKASSSVAANSSVSLTSGLVRLVQVVASSSSSTVSSSTTGTSVPIQVQTVPAGTNLSAVNNIASLQQSSGKIMRIVTVTTGTTSVSTAKPATTVAVAGKPIAPAPIQATSSTGVIVQTPAKQILPKAASTHPRFIMPANAQFKIINPTPGQPARLAQLPAGTALFATPSGVLQPITVLPSNYVAQSVSPAPLQENQGIQVQIKQEQTQTPPPEQGLPQKTNSHSKTNGMVTDGSGRPRKPCNCTKSQCLKLYCDCFANGEFCRDCNCNNCLNNLDHEEDRQKAIKSCLDRNPQAFHPKIGKSKGGDSIRRHNKGCNCKRSGCLKNYCECYEAKIPCSSICKCIGCKNFEESPERKTLMHLANAAEVRHQQQAAAQDKLSSQLQDFPARPAEFGESGERLPFSFMTSEVAEATCNCMLAQAEEAEKRGYTTAMTEKLILEEFGRCLKHVIKSAGRSKGPS